MNILKGIRPLFVIMVLLFSSCEKGSEYDCSIVLHSVYDSHTPGVSKCSKEDMSERIVCFYFLIYNNTDVEIISTFVIEAQLGSRKTKLKIVPFERDLRVPSKTAHNEEFVMTFARNDAVMEKENFEDLGLDIYSTSPEYLAKSLTFSLCDSVRFTKPDRPVRVEIKRDSTVLVLQNSNYSYEICGNCVKRPKK